MLNRKGKKVPRGSRSRRHSHERTVVRKERPVRRRFIISSRSSTRARARTDETRHAHPKAPSPPKLPAAAEQNASLTTQSSVDLTEIIKTLLHLAQENGYVTYDDINDILPDNLSPDDLDELYTKLRTLEVEIVDQAEVERPSPRRRRRTRTRAWKFSTTPFGCT